MKKIIKQIQLLALTLLVSFGLFAQENTGMFKSPEEAANKGKQDLMEVLKSGRDINLGVTADELGQAEPGKVVMRKMLDFDRLLNASRAGSLDEIIAPMGSYASVVPLMVNNKAVTVVEVMEMEGGWKLAGHGNGRWLEVGGLGGSVLAKELTMVMQASKQSEIIIYEVPNLRTLVYEVKEGGREVYYTNYKGKSLRQPVSKAELFEMLQADAKAFQAEFGDKVKEQQLVR
jgi:hypothetical protein